MSENEYKDLSEKTEQKVYGALKLIMAIIFGICRGLASFISDFSKWKIWPLWAKVVFTIILIFLILGLLSNH